MTGPIIGKPWRCEQCGAILGIVVHNSSRKPVLHILWNVMPSESMLPKETLREEVICTIEGAALILCTACGHTRRWVEKERF